MLVIWDSEKFVRRTAACLTPYVLLPLLLLLLLPACGDQKVREPLTITGRTMGTTFMIKISDATLPVGTNADTLEQRINDILTEVNRQMSTYLPDSEISQFNRSRSTDWFQVSSDFASVVQQGLEISDMTGGAFDITVGPLVNLWGFGPENRPQRVPSEEEIEQAQRLTGYGRIAVRMSPPAIKKEIPQLYCDLSAIAKGFGVDEIAGYLDNLGVQNYMAEIGGEVRAKGLNPAEQPWQIGVESPDNPTGIDKIVSISGGALATSGDYFNYFEQDGVRYSHTIDPRTGLPITHKLASVTVIHDSCTMADGLATAINVLGPQAGFEFAQEQELAVYMIVREGDGFSSKMTAQFEAFLSASN